MTDQDPINYMDSIEDGAVNPELAADDNLRDQEKPEEEAKESGGVNVPSEILAYAKQIEAAADEAFEAGVDLTVTELAAEAGRPQAAIAGRNPDGTNETVESFEARMEAEAEDAAPQCEFTDTCEDEPPYESEQIAVTRPVTQEQYEQAAETFGEPTGNPHGRQEQAAPSVPTQMYVYHIFAHVAQPGIMGSIAGLYAFAAPITASTYADSIMQIANQNKLEVGKVMLVNFILMVNDLDG